MFWSGTSQGLSLPSDYPVTPRNRFGFSPGLNKPEIALEDLTLSRVISEREGVCQCTGEGRRADDLLKTKASFHPLASVRLCYVDR